MSIAVRGREDLPWAEYPVLAVGRRWPRGGCSPARSSPAPGRL